MSPGGGDGAARGDVGLQRAGLDAQGASEGGGLASMWPRLLVKVKVTQLCPTVCDSMDCNSPGQNTGVGNLSLLQGIFPAQGSNPGLPYCSWWVQPNAGSPVY